MEVLECCWVFALEWLIYPRDSLAFLCPADMMVCAVLAWRSHFPSLHIRMDEASGVDSVGMQLLQGQKELSSMGDAVEGSVTQSQGM